MSDRGPASPLLLQHGALGDTIQLTAMAQALALRWGAPCDVVAGPPAAPALLAGVDLVGEVRVLGSRRRPYLASPRQWQLVRWLRARSAAPCYVVERWRHRVAPWSSQTRLEWLLARAGIPAGQVVTTVGRERGPLEHAVDYQLRIAGLDPFALAGIAPPVPDPPPRPRLQARADEVADCRAWLATLGWRGEPIVLLQTEARRSRKRGRWPRERWLALLQGLRGELLHGWILLMGVPSERRRTRALAAAAGDRHVLDVAGELPLRRLLALLAFAHSCVSLDTGPAQAAAAVGCPLVVLVGTADPRRNRPLGPPERVQVVTAYGDHPWPDSPVVWFAEHRLEAIPVPAVLAAWRRLDAAKGAAA
ncbi:MAG TPA: glycosyltransferase family 9 protein [Thermoanaerobaculia bacterium]|nr:glycosyltransferase family 9 protein [Thermoanaerobaculia bacterium]